MKEVIVIQRIFPDYQKAVLDAIYKKQKFTLLHSKNKSGIKQVCTPYSKLINKWKYWKGDTRLFLSVFSYIRKNKPKIIIHELAVGILSLPVVFLLRKIWGYKFVLWGHTYNRKIGFSPKKNVSDKYRLWLQRKSDAIITYSNGEKEELISWGIDKNKIFPAPNTVDTDTYLPIRNQLEKIGRENVRKYLGFTAQFNLAFIGRLVEEKWPHYAIDVLDILLRKKSLSIALHFIGSGAMEKSLREYSKKNGLQNNIFFHGEIYDEEKSGHLLFASDMMIMPGYVGLSVNHAFCFDCPVITFETVNHEPAHSPEIEYIIHGKTGFIVKNRSKEDMAETIHNYLHNEQLKRQMKVHIRNMIENVCPMEKLVDGVINAIDYVKKK